VQTLLDGRIARLRPGAKRVLQAAAVLGEHSTIDRLDRVLEMTTHDLLGALDELTEAGLVATNGSVVRPRHDMVTVRILSATSDASRRLLHRRAAIVLEADIERDAPLDATWSCAHHWNATGESGRGLSLVLAAATQLLEIGLPAEAISLTQRARSLCSVADDEFNLLRIEATARMFAGEIEHAAVMFRDLSTQEKDTAPRPIWAADLLSAFELDFRSTRFSSLSASVICGLAADVALPARTRLRAATLTLKIATNTWDTEPGIMSRAWLAVRDITVSSGEDQTQWLLLQMIYHLTAGDRGLGCAALKKLLTLQRGQTPSYATAKVYISMTHAAQICGDLELAAECATAAFSFGVRAKADSAAAWAASNVVELAIQRGELAQAEQWLGELSMRATALGDRLLERDYWRLRARILTLQGDPAGAVAIVSTLLRDSVSQGKIAPRSYHVELATLVDAILQSSPEPVDGQLVEELERIHDQMPTRLLSDWPTLVLCTALDRAGRHDYACRIVETYLAVRRGGPLERSGLSPWIKGTNHVG
jgi:hypothetical protein